MATTETQILDEVIVASRRRLMTVGGVALAGLFVGSTKATAQGSFTDADYLNFALNLEYLEAEFYTLATSGSTISGKGIGVGPGTAATGGGTVTVKPSGYASCMVPFGTDMISYDYGYDITVNEQKHVAFLRGALGSAAVAEPNIDLYNSFNGLAVAAKIGPSFDPFASVVNFLLGSYIFEDVGVTAYHGAAGLLTNSANLGAAASILAIEGYHAGVIRKLLWEMDKQNPSLGIAAITNKISQFRAGIDGQGMDDVALGTVQVALEGASASYTADTIVNADPVNSIAFSRTPQQVLNIVYASATGAKGGFFPNGMNGLIS